jgi:dihydroxy-acid dehydratase
MKKLNSSSTDKLRSRDWFAKDDKMGFVHRSWLRNQGYPDDYFRGKPSLASAIHGVN